MEKEKAGPRLGGRGDGGGRPASSLRGGEDDEAIQCQRTRPRLLHPAQAGLAMTRGARKNHFPTPVRIAYAHPRPRGWPARRMDRPAIRALTGAAARETTGAGVPACEPNVRNGRPPRYGSVPSHHKLEREPSAGGIKSRRDFFLI
jgi:hypothetical protein